MYSKFTIKPIYWRIGSLVLFGIGWIFIILTILRTYPHLDFSTHENFWVGIIGMIISSLYSSSFFFIPSYLLYRKYKKANKAQS